MSEDCDDACKKDLGHESGYTELGVDSADPHNRSEWRGGFMRKTCQKAQSSVEANRALKWI